MINKQDIISIVTPSFNQASYIDETIRSVVTQAGEFFIDYVVKDGGSSDNSVEVIERWAKLLRRNNSIEDHGILFYLPSEKDQLIKCKGISFRWESTPDKGHTDGLNIAFAKTIGEYIAWINSDDKYHDRAFENIHNTFRNNSDIDWIVGINTWWSKTGKLVKEAVIMRNKYDFLTGRYGWLQQESSVWTRRLWDKAGAQLSTEYKLIPDGDLWCRFFSFAQPVFVDFKIAGYRLQGENRAKVHETILLAEMEGAINILRKKQPVMSKLALFLVKFIRKSNLYHLPFINYFSKFWCGYTVIENGRKSKIAYSFSTLGETIISEVYSEVKTLSETP